MSKSAHDEPFAAVRSFEERCHACRRLLSNESDISAKILAEADDELRRKLGLEPGRSILDWAKCLPNDSDQEQIGDAKRTRIERDEKLMGALLREALKHRGKEPAQREVLMLAAAYLYAHERLHPDHPSEREPGPERFDPAVELLGMKGVALALFAEACDWDEQRVMVELVRARDDVRWLPPSSIFDAESLMLKYILGRKWLAEELFLKWMQQHRRGN